MLRLGISTQWFARRLSFRLSFFTASLVSLAHMPSPPLVYAEAPASALEGIPPRLPEPSPSQTPTRPRVRQIKLQGLSRTREHVILRELLLEPGDFFDPALWELSQQEVRNLQIVRVLSQEVDQVSPTEVDLRLVLEERWTFILLSDFARGTDLWYWALGLDDPNTLGTYQEFGFQVDSYGGRISGAAWYRDPRFLYDQTKKRIRFGADFAAIRRNRVLWNSDFSPKAAFSLDRIRFALIGEYQWHRELATGLTLDLQSDEVHDRALTASQKAWNASDGGGPPARPENSGLNLIVRLWNTWGRLHYDDFLVRGRVLKVTFEQSVGLPLTRLGLDSRIFFHLPYRANLGFRLFGGLSSTQAIQHRYSLNPLENVRGFFDGYFTGDHLLQVNTEFRIPSLDTSWVVLQHVAFSDLAWIWGWTTPGASLGIGLRISSPKLFGLLVRLDGVLPLDTRRSPELAFGVQQFF